MFIGLGRRKEASAKVKLISGLGKIIINKHKINSYRRITLTDQTIILKPLTNLGLEKNYDIIIHVHGGGFQSQIKAAQLGVARAISQANSAYRIPLKTTGLLTRDSRSKERRKYGLKKARKAPQFSKR